MTDQCSKYQLWSLVSEQQGSIKEVSPWHSDYSHLTRPCRVNWIILSHLTSDSRNIFNNHQLSLHVQPAILLSVFNVTMKRTHLLSPLKQLNYLVFTREVSSSITRFFSRGQFVSFTCYLCLVSSHLVNKLSALTPSVLIHSAHQLLTIKTGNLYLP